MKPKSKTPMRVKITSSKLNSDLILPEFQIDRLTKSLAKIYRNMGYHDMIKFEFQKL
jgi:hypothetical protein